MAYLLILHIVALVALSIATITDLRTREVPDWLSYGLISFGVGLSLILSLVYWDYWFFANSLIGLVIFLVFALIMFYTGQWGGGDSKVLMGLGALVGFDLRFINSPFLLNFFVNILLIGAIYGFIWSVILAFKNWSRFSKEFKKVSHAGMVVRFRIYLFMFVFLMLILAFSIKGIYMYLFIGMMLVFVATFYLWIFIKAIEKACMIKDVMPDKLTEGDWIVKDIKYKGKYICGPKDLGIEKKQIKELVNLYRANKIKKVLIKEGIPFVPSFLVAYIISLFFGNLLLLLI